MHLFRFIAFLLTLFLSSPAFANPEPPPKDPPAPAETTDQKLAAALRREEDLKTELANEKKKTTPPKDPPPPTGDDDDLQKKVQKNKESNEEIAKQTKQIERALGFNMGITEFVKTNADLLPAEIAEIVKQGNKETYDNAQAKASAIKASMLQSYFSVQANLDALTASQKTTLEDYFKLTKSGKETKAAEVYENIFEPALETMRKVKKAEEVGRTRSGFASDSGGNQAYKDRLINLSRKTHLGMKEA